MSSAVRVSNFIFLSDGSTLTETKEEYKEPGEKYTELNWNCSIEGLKNFNSILEQLYENESSKTSSIIKNFSQTLVNNKFSELLLRDNKNQLKIHETWK